MCAHTRVHNLPFDLNGGVFVVCLFVQLKLQSRIHPSTQVLTDAHATLFHPSNTTTTDAPPPPPPPPTPPKKRNSASRGFPSALMLKSPFRGDKGQQQREAQEGNRGVVPPPPSMPLRVLVVSHGGLLLQMFQKARHTFFCVCIDRHKCPDRPSPPSSTYNQPTTDTLSHTYINMFILPSGLQSPRRHPRAQRLPHRRGSPPSNNAPDQQQQPSSPGPHLCIPGVEPCFLLAAGAGAGGGEGVGGRHRVSAGADQRCGASRGLEDRDDQEHGAVM